MCELKGDPIPTTSYLGRTINRHDECTLAIRKAQRQGDRKRQFDTIADGRIAIIIIMMLLLFIPPGHW